MSNKEIDQILLDIIRRVSPQIIANVIISPNPKLEIFFTIDNDNVYFASFYNLDNFVNEYKDHIEYVEHTSKVFRTIYKVSGETFIKMKLECENVIFKNKFKKFLIDP